METVTFLNVELIIISITVFVVFYLLMMRHFEYWTRKGVVQIKPVPIFGNFVKCFFMKISPGHWFKEFYEKSKNLPYMGVYILNQPGLMLRDPNIIKQILLKDFNNFADKFMESGKNDHLGNANLFIVKNPEWKILRTKISPVFTSGKLRQMFELMTSVGNNLDTYMKSLNLHGSGKAIEIREICAKFTTDLIGTTAYGLEVNSLNNPNAEFRKVGKRIFTYDIFRSLELNFIFIMPQLARLFDLRFFRGDGSAFLKKVFMETLNERERSGGKRKDLIDLLIELKKKYENEDSHGIKFEGDILCGQAAIFFTGGYETSSTTMSCAFYELAKQPDIQEKLRAEIKSALEETDGQITQDLISGLQYLDMVVSETLRMYPILPVLDRKAMNNYQIPGTNIIIEKGTPVFIPLLGMHYDPQYFSKPELFDPERFSEENRKSRTNYVYMPFGEGPRNCIGMRLGLLQTKLGLIHIISQYKLTTCEKTVLKIDPRAYLTTVKGGIVLNARKIN
ncbi:cytochrome P450 6k1-like [Leptopilina heterotoma]|uniref:cytochrome P450 6k1-like n=1 Tax=Leptopilina heterotoma TaxID=63436 RepID=UPI001CAA1054|nr:cytochrome P450 6k1-like [Leptopilina heterotoma]